MVLHLVYNRTLHLPAASAFLQESDTLTSSVHSRGALLFQSTAWDCIAFTHVSAPCMRGTFLLTSFPFLLSRYVLSSIETKQGVKRGERVWQIAFGSGFKCNSAVWRALRPVHTQHEAWLDLPKPSIRLPKVASLTVC